MKDAITKYLIGMLIGGAGAAISLFKPIGDTGYSLWQYMNSPFLSGMNEIFGTNDLSVYKTAFYLCVTINIICFIVSLVMCINEKK